MLEKQETRFKSAPGRDAACACQIPLARVLQGRAVPDVHLETADSTAHPPGAPITAEHACGAGSTWPLLHALLMLHY